MCSLMSHFATEGGSAALALSGGMPARAGRPAAAYGRGHRCDAAPKAPPPLSVSSPNSVETCFYTTDRSRDRLAQDTAQRLSTGGPTLKRNWKSAWRGQGRGWSAHSLGKRPTHRRPCEL